MEKIKLYLILPIIFVFTKAFSQEKDLFSDILGIYLSLPYNTEKKNVEKNNSETFIIMNDKTFQYLITVLKSDDDIDLRKVKDRNEYKKAYLQQCKCDIESEKVFRYNNFISYEFKTKNIVQSQSLYGYVSSISKGKSNYSIIYLAADNTILEDNKFRYKYIFEKIDNIINNR